jgi:hypothetical protein
VQEVKGEEPQQAGEATVSPVLSSLRIRWWRSSERQRCPVLHRCVVQCTCVLTLPVRSAPTPHPPVPPWALVERMVCACGVHGACVLWQPAARPSPAAAVAVARASAAERLAAQAAVAEEAERRRQAEEAERRRRIALVQQERDRRRHAEGQELLAKERCVPWLVLAEAAQAHGACCRPVPVWASWRAALVTPCHPCRSPAN